MTIAGDDKKKYPTNQPLPPNGSKSVFHSILVLSLVHGAVLEVGGAVAASRPVYPLARVVQSVKLVIGEVVYHAEAMRDLTHTTLNT